MGRLVEDEAKLRDAGPFPASDVLVVLRAVAASRLPKLREVATAATLALHVRARRVPTLLEGAVGVATAPTA